MSVINLAPVILFTYNRPDHTKKVLDALAENELAKDSELYIFCDGPKNEKVIEKNDATKKVIEEERNLSRFKCVHIFISTENRGLAKSIISGVTKVIEKYGKCIVLEDDHITSRSFLKYINDCLDYYEDNQKIWSISGFTYPLKTLENYSDDVYLSYRACSHGWGTWNNRWEKVDWEVKDFKKLQYSLLRRKNFNRGGNDLYRMLRHQIRGDRDSWAIRFCYSQSKNNMLTVYPKYSLIKNIGFDGTGTHCQNLGDRQFSNFISGEFCYILKEVSLNQKVIRDFKKQYKISIKEAMEWLIKKISRITERN